MRPREGQRRFTLGAHLRTVFFFFYISSIYWPVIYFFSLFCTGQYEEMKKEKGSGDRKLSGQAWPLVLFLFLFVSVGPGLRYAPDNFSPLPATRLNSQTCGPSIVPVPLCLLIDGPVCEFTR